MVVAHIPGQLPTLTRRRPAQDQWLTVIDADLGARQVDAPVPATHADRDLIEDDYRAGARELLDQPTREWLSWKRSAQRMASYGRDPLQPEPPRPEHLDMLHELLTLARAVQTGPVDVSPPVTETTQATVESSSDGHVTLTAPITMNAEPGDTVTVTVVHP